MTNEEIKNLVLIALASDEQLLETLVLKGGNAIYLLERDKKDGLSRTSYDLDYSIADDFEENLDEITKRIEDTLQHTFQERGFVIIDYSFKSRPSTPQEATKDFWGGYKVEFKIVKRDIFQKYRDNITELRKYAAQILPNGSPKIEIEISKYEYVGKKVEVSLEGFLIYIYSAEMIAFEKVRAICQQFPEYATIIPSHSPRPRARDFYDIYLICSTHPIDPENEESKKVMQSIFDAKRVPLAFIKRIRENSEIHRADWQNVIDTVSAKEDIRDFDFYLNYVISKFGNLTFP